MIQRKQTLFLLLAAICIGGMYLFPLAQYHRLADDARFELKPAGLYNSIGVKTVDFTFTVPLEWLNAAIIIGMCVVVFLYSNRPRQRRVLRGIFLVTLGSAVALVFIHQSVQAYLGTSLSVETSIMPFFFAPFAALLFCWLADRAIRKDEALVKSVDRLR